ncbi:Glycosyltransferase sugar-binding region containing DXD motif protein [Enhygromyxa salina]|uniref:Glycosyltransferase sugar-binding region containing DXD motif protein n=1 Tax=Enhygromyxa salina TaxID=215803 RepID=A0A2S9YEJ6_9BACT|nr:glycosyltransferase [Enhygromyxa salina]PRQ03452.1 Glycosyltransferase sugar-binding region containing DXD motif protein [Enhygromyxa salina]
MIPPSAHFIWFGPRLPWAHALSIRSAALRGGFERVVLHCSDDLSSTPEWAELEALPGFVARRIDASALIRAIGAGGPELAAIYAKLDAPAARANVLRAVILMAEGGVYLDLDTITVRSLDPLRRECGAFCGEERLIWSASVRRTKGLSVHALSLARAGVRELNRRLPRGWRYFRSIEALYPAAANNAVVGAEPGHPFVRRLLDNMIAVPEDRQLVRFALGTVLLQDTIEDQREPDLRVLPPRYFYPLGPEISHHWFRERRSLPALDEVLSPDTLVVHWYASVRTKKIVPRIDPDYVRAHADRQLFSALALPLLPSKDS